jgi:hypothetical protein
VVVPEGIHFLAVVVVVGLEVEHKQEVVLRQIQAVEEEEEEVQLGILVQQVVELVDMSKQLF